MACSLVALIFVSILTNGPDITLAEVHEVNNASDDGNQLDSSIEPLNIQIESTKTEDETGRKIRSAAKEVVDETMTINDGFKVADRDYDQDLVIPQRQLWSQRSLILGESPKKTEWFNNSRKRVCCRAGHALHGKTISRVSKKKFFAQ